MLFLSPLWLLLLIPFAGLVAWSFVRRGTTVSVPFVQLWRGDAVSTRQRGARRPPLVVLLLLASVLLAILAAASPAWRGADGGSVTVVVDRGATMSIDMRYRAALDDALKQIVGAGMIARIIAVPTFAGSIARSADLPPTAVDTATLLPGAINDATEAGSPVVVVTDQDVPSQPNDPIVRATPVGPQPDRVSIAYVAARSTPQVMVRLRNESAVATVEVTVASASSKQVMLDLPSRGQTCDYFLDVGPLSTNIAVSVGDGLGQQAWLALESPNPAVEAIGPVPPAVERTIAAYRRARPPNEGGRRVVVTVSPAEADQASQGGAGSILLGSGPGTRVANRVQIDDHPLTRDIDWRSLVNDAALVGRPPTGYTAIASAGVPLVAVGPQRQVWVGLEAKEGTQSVDWVILWTRLFDWLGDGTTQQWGATPPQQLDAGWRRIRGSTPNATEPGLWPGLFGHADGRLRAINAPDVVPKAEIIPTADWARLTRSTTRANARSIAPGVGFASLSCLCGAVVLASVGRHR